MGALHDHLNRSSGVSFTVEEESGGLLPFLDVEVRSDEIKR